MNLSARCWQVLKVGVKSGRNCSFRHPNNYISSTFATRLRFYDGRNAIRHLPSSQIGTPFRYFTSTSTSRSASSSSSSQKSKESSDDKTTVAATPEEDLAKLGLIARFKKMYKEYWYVLVPVHLATSAVWLGSFYYASKSGMDIVAIMQSWNFNETLIKPFRDSSMGHVAVAYLLYKIATPARYTVTLGTTTVAIKHLVRLGYIKPVPTRAEMIQMYQDKKEIMQTRVADKKAELKERSDAMKEEYETFKEDFRDSMKSVGSVSNPQPPPIPEEQTTPSDSAQHATTPSNDDEKHAKTPETPAKQAVSKKV